MLVVSQLRVIPLFQGELNILLHYAWIHRVGHVKQVVSVTLPTFGISVRKVFQQALKRHQLVIEVLH